MYTIQVVDANGHVLVERPVPDDRGRAFAQFDAAQYESFAPDAVALQLCDGPRIIRRSPVSPIATTTVPDRLPDPEPVHTPTPTVVTRPAKRATRRVP